MEVDLAIVAGRLALSEARALHDGWLTISGGRIQSVGTGPAPPAASVVDAGGAWIAPGLVDTHVHGGGGGDVMSVEPDERRAVRRMHARHGTTALAASTVTAPSDELERAVERLARDADGELLDGARPLGIHLEGPFLSPQRKGAHRSELLRDPDADELRRLVRAGRGHVASITVAPELPHARSLIEQAVGSGLVAYVGHTDADFADIEAAVEAGARGLTHTYNCMRPLHHRRAGGVGAGMVLDGLTCELILDLVHVDAPAALALVHAAGPGRVCLVTDAMSAAGMPDGGYLLGGQDVELTGGRVVLAGTDTLAGSCLTMDVAVQNAVRHLGLPVPAVVEMASRVPADLLGRADVGRLQPGSWGDVVLLGDDGGLQGVWVGGRAITGDAC